MRNCWCFRPTILTVTASENDERDLSTSSAIAMSNVDAVSLPAALDPGRSALAVNVNPQSFPKPPSPNRKPSQQIHPSDDDALKKDPSAGDGDAPLSPKADSEAETIIQSGRESLSPEKRRKYITHEPKRHDDRDDNVGAVERDSPNDLQFRKRKVMDDDSLDGADRDGRPSSPSPRAKSPAPVKVEKVEGSHPLPSKPPAVETTETVPRSEENRTSRKRSFSESVEGDAEYRINQPPPPVAPAHRGRNNLNGVSLPRPASNDRSVSPMRPSHSRTSSGQQLGGDSYKAKKGPAPLITGFHRQGSEDRLSVSSSASGSPLPGAHLRKFASVDGASASPAKPMGHKKQRDQNGRTRLARACAAQELEVAVARLSERPEDLNIPDNAGNTPLQIASLEGCAPIVKILLEAGCDIETKNIDKDTPLIDAVENGHLDVIKLLLEAGANPRTLNAEGDEPYELVPTDIDEYEEIRRVLSNAKEKTNSRTSRRSEDRPGPKDRSSRRLSDNSPRESPTMTGPRSPPLFGATTKRRTVRSEATRNDLLWTKATPENLREFASKGDIAGVANILNVGQRADAESLIAATKGGHDEVLSLLLGMGDADPDPEPLQGGQQKPGYNTPMLAAIGRGNLAVIKLLLDQPGFNPTRRLYRDRAYFELSKERKAENWEEEYDLLKAAYDNFGKVRKLRKPDGSSPRRAREKERENRRHGRRDSPSPVARSRKPGSPNGSHRESSSKDIGPSKERKRELLQSRDRPVQGRAKTFRREGSDHPAGSSDPDVGRLESPRPKGLSHAQRDGEPGVSRGDEAPKRRRLIAGRPPQDRGRRPSLLSSDSWSGRDEGAKRADSPPGLASKNGGPPLKRVRSSESPDRLRGQDSERAQELQKKKRRVVSEDGTPKMANGGLKNNAVEDIKTQRPPSDDADSRRRTSNTANSPSLKDAADRKSPERNVVKEEREKHERNDLGDIPMEDSDNAENRAKKAEEEAEERRREKARKAEEERVAEQKRQAAEAEKVRLAKEDEERAARLAREKAEDEERRRKEAEQRRIKQAEDERQKRLEQERLRIEKLRREQEEQERRRRAALPNRLRIAANLIGSSDPRARSRVWLKKFMPVVLTDTKNLDPKCEPDAADEKWVPNFLVAPLLATNDLQLSQCKLSTEACKCKADWF